MVYGSDQEPMACGLSVALLKTTAGSLACRQILADFLQSIEK